MSEDIENNDTYGTRKKVSTTKWRPIYVVIDEAYIEESKLFSDGFIRYCKNSSSKAKFISDKLENNINKMAIEKS